MKQLPLCKCGCGNQVENRKRKYFSDHYKCIQFKPVPKIELNLEITQLVPTLRSIPEGIDLPKPEPVTLFLKNLAGHSFTSYLTNQLNKRG